MAFKARGEPKQALVARRPMRGGKALASMVVHCSEKRATGHRSHNEVGGRRAMSARAVAGPISSLENVLSE